MNRSWGKPRSLSGLFGEEKRREDPIVPAGNRSEFSSKSSCYTNKAVPDPFSDEAEVSIQSFSYVIKSKVRGPLHNDVTQRLIQLALNRTNFLLVSGCRKRPNFSLSF